LCKFPHAAFLDCWVVSTPYFRNLVSFEVLYCRIHRQEAFPKSDEFFKAKS
jgi:hypothetical protein